MVNGNQGELASVMGSMGSGAAGYGVTFLQNGTLFWFFVQNASVLIIELKQPWFFARSA
jgi:hypothetical protein